MITYSRISHSEHFITNCVWWLTPRRCDMPLIVSPNFVCTYIWAPSLILPRRRTSSPTCNGFGNAAINGITVILYFDAIQFCRYEFRAETYRIRVFFVFSGASLHHRMFSIDRLRTNKVYCFRRMVSLDTILPSILTKSIEERECAVVTRNLLCFFERILFIHCQSVMKDTLRKALVTVKNKSALITAIMYLSIHFIFTESRTHTHNRIKSIVSIASIAIHCTSVITRTSNNFVCIPKLNWIDPHTPSWNFAQPFIVNRLDANAICCAK